MTEEDQNQDFNPFDVQEKHADFPEFFKGMACGYEDVARMLETMKENLPPELKFMDSGMETMIAGVRGKIGALEVVVLTNMANAAKGEGNMQ